MPEASGRAAATRTQTTRIRLTPQRPARHHRRLTPQRPARHHRAFHGLVELDAAECGAECNPRVDGWACLPCWLSAATGEGVQQTPQQVYIRFLWSSGPPPTSTVVDNPATIVLLSTFQTFLRKIDHVAGGVVGDDKVFSDAADSRRQRAARFLGFTSNACPKSSTFLGGLGRWEAKGSAALWKSLFVGVFNGDWRLPVFVHHCVGSTCIYCGGDRDKLIEIGAGCLFDCEVVLVKGARLPSDKELQEAAGTQQGPLARASSLPGISP